jgi:hypothetical protein
MLQPVDIPSQPLMLLNAREVGGCFRAGIFAHNRLERPDRFHPLRGPGVRRAYMLDRVNRFPAVRETLNGDNH